jgi:cytochrome c biogenesis protein CcmG/thiol:disulfide interchange protein DsbE
MKYTLILAGVLAIAGYSYYQSQKLVGSLSSQTDFILKNLPAIGMKDIAGKRVDLYKYMDDQNLSILVIHFWGTWCAPCEAEFPELIKFAKKFEKNPKIGFLFVAVDDELAKVKKFMNRFYKTYPKAKVLIDNDKLYKTSFGTTRVPETFVFNKYKKTKRKFSGAVDWQNDYFFSLFNDFIKN